jgi:hypothetical protein
MEDGSLGTWQLRNFWGLPSGDGPKLKTLVLLYKNLKDTLALQPYTCLASSF